MLADEGEEEFNRHFEEETETAKDLISGPSPSNKYPIGQSQSRQSEHYAKHV